jgi:hypothetical protein
MVRRAFFYTDGSLTEGCVGFVVHQMGMGGFGHKLSLVLCLLHYNTLLRLYGLRKDVLFSLIA